LVVVHDHGLLSMDHGPFLLSPKHPNIAPMQAAPDLHFCLLIPVYNNWEGLLRSLKSINYPSGHHLVVIVDDGSLEPITTEMLGAAALESPFHLICLPQNKGITEALNTGLRWIKEHTTARYIARLDCSDTCHPNRFHRQVAFLDAHPEVGLLGTWCTFQSEDGSISYPYTTPLEHAAIEKEMHLRNVFIHPTVMWRAALLDKAGVYPYDFPNAEDYALFWALIKISKGAVLDQYLVTCAFSGKGISMGNREAQLKSRWKVVRHFGNNRVRQLLGFFKTKLLLFVPQRVILWLKKL
jgi:glycosyltransferase involved in cell wall biosynthesis